MAVVKLKEVSIIGKLSELDKVATICGQSKSGFPGWQPGDGPMAFLPAAEPNDPDPAGGRRVSRP